MILLGIVAQNDLIDALKSGTIFAAGLDVMVPEPLPANDELTKLPNCGNSKILMFIFKSIACFSLNLNFFGYYVVVVPHLGSATIKTRDDMAILSAQNVINGIEGKPLIYSAY